MFDKGILSISTISSSTSIGVFSFIRITARKNDLASSVDNMGIGEPLVARASTIVGIPVAYFSASRRF